MTESPDRRRTRDRPGTESALMDAALRLLERNGVLQGLNLRDVADEAGVNRGLITHYFGSRRTLLRSALARAQQELGTRYRGYWSLNPAERGLKMFESRGEANRARMVMLLALDGDEELAPVIDYEDTVGFLLDEQARGGWRPDVDVPMVLVVWTTLHMGYLVLRPALMRMLGVSQHELDMRLLETMGQMFGPLWEPPQRQG